MAELVVFGQCGPESRGPRFLGHLIGAVCPCRGGAHDRLSTGNERAERAAGGCGGLAAGRRQLPRPGSSGPEVRVTIGTAERLQLHAGLPAVGGAGRVRRLLSGRADRRRRRWGGARRHAGARQWSGRRGRAASGRERDAEVASEGWQSATGLSPSSQLLVRGRPTRVPGGRAAARKQDPPMRIAMVAPLIESVPPPQYGGTERVVSVLAEELVRRGHDVTLFASGDSHTRAHLWSCCPRGLRLDSQVHDYLPHSLHELGEVYRHSDEFDLIHSHVDWTAFPFADLVQTPTVSTVDTGGLTMTSPALPTSCSPGSPSSPSATRNGARSPRRTGWRRSTTASTSRTTGSGPTQATTWCFWDGSALRSVRTARSRSPARWACAS